MSVPIKVHIGFPKTGTTWLQRMLFPRFEGCLFLGKLNDKIVLDNASLDTESKAILYDLGSALTDPCGVPSKVIYKGLKTIEALGANRTVLISKEGLTGDVRKGFYNRERIWGELLRLGDVDIAITSREQTSWLRSLYKYCVQSNGLTLKFDRFVGFDARSGEFRCSHDVHFQVGIRSADWACAYRSLREIFPRSQLMIFPMELIQKDLESAESAWGEFVGLSITPSRSQSLTNPVNASLDDRYIPLFRARNFATRGSGQIFGLSHRNWESLMFKSTDRTVRSGVKIISHLFRPPDDIVPNATYAALRSYYGASNIELQKILSLDLRSLGYSLSE